MGGRAAAAAMLLVAATLGCSEASGDTQYYGTTVPRHAADEVWYNLGIEPEWIDPGKASDNAGGTVILNMFAGLAQGHPQTLEPMPDVARGWSISEDGRRYTFYLRETTWSDGTPLVAEDFAWSWRRVLARETASKYATFVYPVRYAAAFHALAVLVTGLPADATEDDLRSLLADASWIERVQWAPDLAEPAPSETRPASLEPSDAGRTRAAFLFLASEPAADADDASDAPTTDRRAAAVAQVDGASLRGARLSARLARDSDVGVRALDALTLEVDLETPLPYFLQLISFYTMLPVPRHVLERLEREGKNPALWTRPENIVSNGAFTLADWRFRQHMVLERNPAYWNAESVGVSRVKMLMIESSTTALNMYKTGELDTIGNGALPQEFLERLKRYEDYESAPWLGTYFYWLNTEEPPLDDPRVRLALKLALDRKSIVEFVTRAGQRPTADLVPDGLAGYAGLATTGLDVERARALLTEAGYPGGKGLPTITLAYNTSEGHKSIAQAVQQMWRENLGIPVEIENQEWKVYLGNLEAMNFQIARMGWIGDFADPYTFLELLTSGNGNNHSLWADPAYDGLLRKANETTDPAARLAILRQAEALAMEATPLIPIYTFVQTTMHKPYLRGAWPNFQSRHLFKYYSIDPRFYDGVPDVVVQEPAPPVLRPERVPERAAAPQQVAVGQDPS